MKGLPRFAIAALLTATVAPVAFAQQPAVHQEPYEEFYSELVRFYDKKDRDRLVLRTTLLAQDGKTLIDPIRIRIATREGVTEVPVTTDNEFMMPFNPAWVKEGAMVEINQPEKNYRIRAQIGMKLPEGDCFPYAEIVAAFDQFNKLIDKEAGVLSFVAPSAKAIRFHCGMDCRVTLSGPKGERVLTADDQGRVVIPNDKAMRRENPTVLVNRPVAYTVLTTKG